MPLGIPVEMDCRKSNKKPLDLLKEAMRGIDALADKYAMLATNHDVQIIYAQLDGARFKLENIPQDIRQNVTEQIEDDGKPLDARGAVELVWGLLTKE